MVFVAFFLAVTLFFGMGGGVASAFTASAAKNAPAAGWYVVGTGAGTLKGGSWLEYAPNNRLSGTSYDDPSASYQDYLGFWQTDSMLLYEGDQFKFLYNDGSWISTEASGWGKNITAGFSDIADNVGSAFASAGLGNIQVKAGHSGYYTFYLYATRTAQGAIALTLTFYLDASKSVPPLNFFEMYVVGDIASVPDCGWADEINVAQDGIKMTYSAQTDRWYSSVIYLVPTDSFKVYDLVTGVYYPSGVADNRAVSKAGWYYVQWGAYDQTYSVISVAAPNPDPEPELPASGWYVVGNGAGSLADCSWTEFVPEYKVADDYIGEFTLPEMLLYPGDSFKLLYTDGTDETPDATGWTADVVAQFGNLLDNPDLAFVDGGLGNIEAIVSGYYTFTLYVVQDADIQEVFIGLTYERSDKEVPEINLFEMYVVGTIASNPANNWPPDTDVAENCIKMDYNATTDKWTARVTLVAENEFKVYNLVNRAYYPSGVYNYYTGYEGEFVIEWSTGAPDILVIPASEYPFT